MRKKKSERVLLHLHKDTWHFYQALSERSGVELDKVVAVALALYSLQIKPREKAIKP